MRATLASILFVGLVSIVGIAASAQEVYSQKERDQFREGVYKGCLDKQSRNDINAHLLPAVIEESCKCFSEKATADVFGSMEFQLAISRKDGKATNRVISQIMAPEAATRIIMACLQVSIDRRGGHSKIVKEGPALQLSTQIGLAGDNRRGYIDGGVQTCKDSQRQMPDNKGISDNLIEAYCKCVMNYSADRVSPTNVVEMLKQKPSAVKLQEKLAKASGNFCREKLFGIKTK